MSHISSHDYAERTGPCAKSAQSSKEADSIADEGYSQVAYEKASTSELMMPRPDNQGSNFLLLIERTVGGVDNFIPYMRDYVKTFNGSSITTDQWRSHLFHYFGKVDGGRHVKELAKIDWDEVSQGFLSS